MIKVMVIDDHIVVRAGITSLLDTDPNINVVGESKSAEEAQGMYTSINPDVIIMDLSMPGMGGIEATKRILARSPNTNILVYSLHEESLYAQRAMEAGAKGYVTKASEQEVLIQAVKAVASGQRFISPDIASEYALKKMIQGDDPIKLLSDREFEILVLISKGYTTHEIAKKLHLSDKTVSNNISRFKKKLELKTTADIVHFAIQHHLL